MGIALFTAKYVGFRGINIDVRDRINKKNHFNDFPHKCTSNSADDIKNILAKMNKNSIYKGFIIKIELKVLWQKEKLLMMSNFSFCHNVFKSRLMQRLQKAYIYEGKS